MKFTGQLKFPDIDHPGIPVVFVVDDIHIELDVDAEAVGRWSLVDVEATRLVASAFLVNLDGEEVTFIADEPLDFAYQGVEHMAETWARVQSLSLPRRSVAMRKSRRGTMPSRIFELREAVLETLEEPAPLATPPRVQEQIPHSFQWALETEDVDAEETEEAPSILLPGPGLVASLARMDAVPDEEKLEAAPVESTIAAADTEEDSLAAVVESPELETVAVVEEDQTEAAPEIDAETPIKAWFEEDERANEESVDPLEWPEPAAAPTPVEITEPLDSAEEPIEETPAADIEETPAAEVEELELPEETKQLLGTPAGSDEGLFVDLGRYEDSPPEPGPPSEEPEPEDGAAVSPEPALVGPQPEKAGLLGAVRSAFGRSSRVAHEHEFVDAPGGMGLTRQICAECGHISIRSDD